MLDLWCAPEAPPALPVLDTEETLRQARLAQGPLQEAYARAHSFKRRVLSHYVPGEPPGAWRFRVGPAGKPVPGPAFPFHFNLSHSGGCVAVAVGDRAVGVDVEVPRPLPMATALADRVFHVHERAWLARQTGFDPAFWRLWTLKEALLKAAGTGFTQPPSQVAWHALDEPWAVARFAGRRWRGWGGQAGGVVWAVAIDADASPTPSPRPDLAVRVVHVEAVAEGDGLHGTVRVPLPESPCA